MFAGDLLAQYWCIDLGFLFCDYHLSEATPAEPRGDFFFVQILGGEKLLKLVEKWAVKKN